MRFSNHFFRLLALLCFCLVSLSSAGYQPGAPVSRASYSYIVQAGNADLAARSVINAGGRVTRRLAIINAVSASLDSAAVQQLQADQQIALYADRTVRVTADEVATAPSDLLNAVAARKPGTETDTSGYLLYPSAATGAQVLHQQQIAARKTECANQRVTTSTTIETQPLQGRGVTVAVIDSGFMQMKTVHEWRYRDPATGTLVAENAGRCIVYRDFLPRTAANDNAGAVAANSTDQNGHGTHVASTIADNRATPLAPGQPASPVGVAPQVNLLVARALDKDGAGSYGDVIAAIEWVISTRATYNVRILNLSLYAPVSGPYWADPLNQAVMKAWQSGITVVVAAGNSGPDAGAITVPGNVPYVITVGAVKSGRYTTSGDDELAAYSSRGPTESAFVKPDVVVPASRTIAPMPIDSVLASEVAAGRIQEKAKVDYKIGKPMKEYAYYQLSGTSMATAEVSGVAALIVQANPMLTNNQIKYRLMSTARPAIDDASGQPAYTPWEQGAGLIDALRAVTTTTTASANEGMNLNLDLNVSSDPQTHYWGWTTWVSETGEFQLIDATTGQVIAVWSGGTKSWAGGTKSWAGGTTSWAGGTKSWAGGTKSWAGGTKSWAGSVSLWAGGTRIWAGSTPNTSLETASQGELLVNEDYYPIMLPLVMR